MPVGGIYLYEEYAAGLFIFHDIHAEQSAPAVSYEFCSDLIRHRLDGFYVFRGEQCLRHAPIISYGGESFIREWGKTGYLIAYVAHHDLVAGHDGIHCE